MQAPTHILSGVLIEKITSQNIHSRFNSVIIAGSCVVIHIISDKFARLTYHPPDALYSDPFWVVYHISLLVGTLVSLKMYWKDYKLGIIASILPDIDWIIFRPITTVFPNLDPLKGPVTHRVLENLLSLILPLNLLDDLPNWQMRKPTIVIEIALVALLLFCIIRLGSSHDQRNLKAKEA
jgi:hypothetical protein